MGSGFGVLGGCGETRNFLAVAGEWDFLTVTFASDQKYTSRMQLSHARPIASIVFDEPNLVSEAGLVPLVRLAESAGLRDLSDDHLSVPGDKGANAGL